MVAVEKACNVCNVVKPLDSFHRTNARGGKHGRVPACKECRNAALKSARLIDPTKERVRRMASKTLRAYGLTADDIKALYDAQQGLCKICGQPDTTKRGVLHIDHCHATGTVRGLLCHHCNLMLGNARDDTAILQKAIAYLAIS